MYREEHVIGNRLPIDGVITGLSIDYRYARLVGWDREYPAPVAKSDVLVESCGGGEDMSEWEERDLPLPGETSCSARAVKSVKVGDTSSSSSLAPVSWFHIGSFPLCCEEIR
jgi:hypothetical protein